MIPSLSGRRVAILERPHPAGHRGSLIDALVPELRGRGADVSIICAEEGWHRADAPLETDIMVLKSGLAAALHAATAAEAWGIPCVNSSDATRLTQDKLASSAILQQAGVPVAPSHFAWLGGASGFRDGMDDALLALNDERLLLKAARGSQGDGLWPVEPGALAAQAAHLAPGPYLIMGWIPHQGNDLKVFIAGDWMTAIERPFPATTLAEKQGRPAQLPSQVAEITGEVGRLLGLTCYGCDFVHGTDGWMLVDVNAFPGYKGASAAPVAIADQVALTLREGIR